MKIIFLDIDGVLVNRAMLIKHSGWAAEGDPGCVAALNRIIKETDAAIVISSSWRLAWSTEQMEMMFADWGLKNFRIIGETPNIWGTARGHEIESWCRTYEFAHDGYIESFVIIDDDPDMLEYQKRFFVQTYLIDGLTEQDADKAIKILKEEKYGEVQSEECNKAVARGCS